MDLMSAHPYISILLALIIWEIGKQFINYFFKRVTKDDYLTRDDCRECHKEQDNVIRDIKSMIGEIREILLVVAVESGVDVDKVKKLTKAA